MDKQLPLDIMKRAAKGISYIAHPLRLRILEFLDVNGAACVSDITKAVGEEQVIVSQNLRKLRDAHLVKTKRRGLFIYYQIQEEYPASIFTCLRKLYAYMTDSFYYLSDQKILLPHDYVVLVANQIKLFANFEKMRILEYLTLNGEANVSDIIKAVDSEQLKVSQNLKRLKDDGFVVSHKKGRFVFYSITQGVAKTAIQCIHKRYDALENKDDF